jgi:hypothetical protein
MSLCCLLLLIALSDRTKRVDDKVPTPQYIETIIRAVDGYVSHFRSADISVWERTAAAVRMDRRKRRNERSE